MDEKIVVPDSVPDFKMFFDKVPLHAVKSVGENWEQSEIDETSMPVVRGIGSSEIIDTDGDVFHREALESLCEASVGMTTWLNHKYDLPDSLFGSLIEKPRLAMRKASESRGIFKADRDFAVVEIVSDVETDSLPAMKTYRFSGRRQLGFSVGCLYTKYKKRSDGPRGTTTGVDVYEVRPVEWSVVGLPANQESWIGNLRKSMKFKGIIDSEDDVPGMLYAVRNWDGLPEPMQAKMGKLQHYLKECGYDIGTPDKRRAF